MGKNIWKKFLVTDISGKIITTFKDIFLGIYFLKITQGNIVDVSIYYIALYLTYPIFLYLVNKLKKMNLINIFRLGLFLNLVKCIILLVSGKNIVNYIIPFGILDSLGDAFYYYSQQILIKRLNKEDNFKRYFTANYILKSVLGIIMPTVFGFCITNNSYDLAFFILTMCTFISFINSFTIRGYNLEHQKINLMKFYKNIKEKDEMNIMKLMTYRTFARGISSYGVLTTLITIITFMVLGSELSLGNINSFITILSMVIIYLIGKYVSKKALSKKYVPISIIQSVIILVVTFSMIFGDINIYVIGNSITLGVALIFIYNIVNGICNPIFEYSNNIVYYECMAKQKIGAEDEPNYNFWFEVVMNFSRMLGYIVLILVSKLGFNLNVISCLIVVFTLMYVFFAYTLKEIEQKYLIEKV